MLGHFLEIALAARPVAASFELYASLGFNSIPVGDAPHAPAAAFFDGSVTIGLYDAEPEHPVLTFVRPSLKDYVRGLRRLGIELERARLGDSELHEVRFADPDGQAVRLIEARTFAPGTWDERKVSACGKFVEYCMSVESLERASAFWRALGFVSAAEGAEPHGWERLAGHGITLGLHATRFRAGLRFAAPHVGARIEYLKAKRLDVRATCPFAGERPAATLAAPEGTPLYLLEDGRDG